MGPRGNVSGTLLSGNSRLQLCVKPGASPGAPHTEGLPVLPPPWGAGEALWPALAHGMEQKLWDGSFRTPHTIHHFPFFSQPPLAQTSRRFQGTERHCTPLSNTHGSDKSMLIVLKKKKKSKKGRRNKRV